MKLEHRVMVDCDNTCGIPGLPIDDGQTMGDHDTEAAAWLAMKAGEESGRHELLAIGAMTNLHMPSYLVGMIRRHEGAQEDLWDLLPGDSGPRINLPDYIVDVESSYSILYESWGRAFLGASGRSRP